MIFMPIYTYIVIFNQIILVNRIKLFYRGYYVLLLYEEKKNLFLLNIQTIIKKMKTLNYAAANNNDIIC